MMSKAVQTLERIDPPRGNIPAVTTPSHLLAMAVEQGADLDKLEKLMALQERWETGEARKAFTVAMTGFRAEPVDIFKNKNVAFSGTSYNHAELSDVTAAINPALARHDLSFRWDVQQEGSQITVACILTHIAGHSERINMAGPPDDSGKKNRIQQIASTVTYLQRYTLLAITGMSTKDAIDDDGRGYEAEPETVDAKAADWIKQVEQLQEPGDWAPLKAKMMADYGGIVKAIPNEVKQAFVDVKARIMPKDSP